MPSDGVPQMQIRWLAEVIKRVSPGCKTVSLFAESLVVFRRGSTRGLALA